MMTIPDTQRRLQKIAQRFRSVLQTPNAKRAAWAVAVIVFLGGLTASVVSQPQLFQDIKAQPVIVVFAILAPMMIGANVLSIKEIARLSGARLSAAAALRLTVMSAAANHLPVPGGAILRIVAFREAGATLKAASLANISAALLWVTATFLLAGVFAFRLGNAYAALLVAAGVMIFAVAIGMVRNLPDFAASCFRLFLISFGAAILYAAAIYYAFAALGADAGLAQSAVISAAGVIGAAIALTPSGLGVREAASAILAVLVGVAPGAAFTAVAAVYLAMMTLMGAIAVLYASERNEALDR